MNIEMQKEIIKKFIPEIKNNQKEEIMYKVIIEWSYAYEQVLVAFHGFFKETRVTTTIYNDFKNKQNINFHERMKELLKNYNKSVIEAQIKIVNSQFKYKIFGLNGDLLNTF